MLKWEESVTIQQQDDMDPPHPNFDAAAQSARFAFCCGQYISEDAHRLTWNKGDFFGERYGAKSN